MTDAEKIAAFDKMQEKTEQPEADTPLRLDIGCGKNKKEGFVGLDQYDIPGVDVVCDLREKEWRLKWMPHYSLVGKIGEYVQPKTEEGWFRLSDNSVDEVNCSHFVEHLTAIERVRFMNELYRVMKPGAKATITTPHWCSNRAYGDMTHQWPPVSEMWFYYLSKQWREDQVPHTDKRWNPEGYDCDFEAGWGYSMHPSLLPRNLEFQQDALQFKKEAAQDIIATLTKK